MGNIFGKKKVSRVTNHDRAVLQMKQQRDKLKQYQQRIERTLENERLLAKKLLNEGKRDRAKLLLKKKRYQEQLLSRTDGQLENLETLVHDLEFAQIETQVVEGLKVGNDALKKVNDMINIEEVEKILDETREGIEKQKEIDDLLSGAMTAEDDEAVEEEFAQLIADQQNKSQLPTDEQIENNVKAEEEKEEEELVLPDVPTEEPEREKVSEPKKAKKIAVAAE
ncbi:charged multivesicular body protein 6 [Nilaparvata lugens]|uniref:charged multivesicular body protein 6 n=1 Tax=Nilaparvata lugens TaxID=108931 RepID=UPI00193E0B19|nr:charged multivesicular body protein 6 [Nilaparvata lugens]